jgi:hypothetical protein
MEPTLNFKSLPFGAAANIRKQITKHKPYL